MKKSILAILFTTLGAIALFAFGLERVHQGLVREDVHEEFAAGLEPT